MTGPVWHNRANNSAFGDSSKASIPHEPADAVPDAPAIPPANPQPDSENVPRWIINGAAAQAAATPFYPGGDLLDFATRASSFDLDFGL